MSANLGKSESDSESKSSFEQNVWEGQSPYLQDLYGAAGNLWGNTLGGMGFLNTLAMGLNPYMSGLMGGAEQGFGNLMGGGAFGDTTDIRNELMDSMRRNTRSNMGTMYESIVGGPGNTYIDPMVDAMKRSSMENLDLMRSNTGVDMAGYGQGGSSRHARENAMTSQLINQDMLDREMSMRGGAYDKDLAMKMDIARMADQNVQSNQDRMFNMLAGANQSRMGGLQLAPNMTNLGMGSMAPWMTAMSMPWSLMGNYAAALGRPTILGSGDSSAAGSSNAWNLGFGIG